MDNVERSLKHSDLLYDYIKFHLGLYIATPPVLAIIALAVGVEKDPVFQNCMMVLVVVYFIAGLCASWHIATYINVKWEADTNWTDFGLTADSWGRRILHHYLYWIGLIIALGGIASVRF